MGENSEEFSTDRYNACNVNNSNVTTVTKFHV